MKSASAAWALAGVAKPKRASVLDEAARTGRSVSAVVRHREVRTTTEAARAALSLLRRLPTKALDDPDHLYNLLADIADEADALRSEMDAKPKLKAVA